MLGCRWAGGVTSRWLTCATVLQENLSYKATAERLVLHKNTVQYRVRKAEESLQHPVAQDRLLVELALLATQRLGAAVPRPGAGARVESVPSMDAGGPGRR